MPRLLSENLPANEGATKLEGILFFLPYPFIMLLCYFAKIGYRRMLRKYVSFYWIYSFNIKKIMESYRKCKVNFKWNDLFSLFDLRFIYINGNNHDSGVLSLCDPIMKKSLIISYTAATLINLSILHLRRTKESAYLILTN